MVNTPDTSSIDVEVAGTLRRRSERLHPETKLGPEQDDQDGSESQSSLTEVVCNKLPWIGDHVSEREAWKLDSSSGRQASGRFEPPERRPSASAAQSAWENDRVAGPELEPAARRPADRPAAETGPNHEQLMKRDEHGNYLPLMQRTRRKLKTVTICPNMEEEVSGNRLAAFRKLKSATRSLDDFEPVRDVEQDQKSEGSLSSPRQGSSRGGDSRRQEDEPDDCLISSLLQSVPRAVDYDKEDPFAHLREVTLSPDADDGGCVGHAVLSCGDLPDLTVVHRPQRRLKTVHVTTPSLVPAAPKGGRPGRPVRRPSVVTFSADVKWASESKWTSESKESED